MADLAKLIKERMEKDLKEGKGTIVVKAKEAGAADEALEEAISDFISAVKSEDTGTAISAFRAAMDICMTDGDDEEDEAEGY